MSKLYERINKGFNRRYLKEDEDLAAWNAQHEKNLERVGLDILKEEAFNDAYDYISGTYDDFKDTYEGQLKEHIIISIFLKALVKFYKDWNY